MLTGTEFTNNAVSIVVTGTDYCSSKIPDYKIKVASTLQFSETAEA